MTYHLLILFRLFKLLPHLGHLVLRLLARLIGNRQAVLHPLDLELVLIIFLLEGLLLFETLGEQALGVGEGVLQLCDLN